MTPKKPGSKERIRQFFRANIGKVVTSIQIRDAIGPNVSEWRDACANCVMMSNGPSLPTTTGPI
jgi:hypothetical protein